MYVFILKLNILMYYLFLKCHGIDSELSPPGRPLKLKEKCNNSTLIHILFSHLPVEAPASSTCFSTLAGFVASDFNSVSLTMGGF